MRKEDKYNFADSTFLFLTFIISFFLGQLSTYHRLEDLHGKKDFFESDIPAEYEKDDDNWPIFTQAFGLS